MTEQFLETADGRLTDDLNGLASVFNLSDVAIHVKPGQGWSCEPTEDGIVMNVDPMQLAGSDGTTDETAIMFAGRHELQHARDMLDPDWSRQPDLASMSASDAFFWNFLHDITIDGRTVNDYRGYREAAPDIYKNLVKDTDARKQPKHIQLMQGLRFQSVLEDESPLKVDRDVQAVIDRLRNHDGHDLTEVLQHKGTSLAQRIALAQQYFKPEFDKLLEEERESHSEEELEQQAREAGEQGDMSSGSGQGEKSDEDENQGRTFEEQLQDAVNEYQAAQDDGEAEDGEDGGGDQEEEDDADDGENETDSQGGKGSVFGRLGERAMEALGSLKDELQGDDSPPPESEESIEEIIGRLGGTVKQELHLRGSDAEAYARALVMYRQMIGEVAELFKRLARVDRSPSRMIYNRQALPEGERLHTGHLPQAYIQGVSDIPMDIWRGKERKAPRIIRQFNGLDIYLHVDASKSMNGTPARHAAEMGLVLTEGLLLARRQQAREVQGKQPDVRLGCMIFAGGTETAMPLSFEPTGRERANMYLTVKKADQYSTLVCPGIRTIFEDAQSNPARDVIGIVISDNEFGDAPHSLMYSKPQNCLIWNFSLGGGDAIGVGKYAAPISQTAELPAKLLQILQYYERQFE